MYPAFASGVRHYAVRCGSSTTLRVRAQASRTAATVTLLRADASDNQTATGSLDASVAVSGEHDVAIELTDGSDTIRYVVHCVPTDFPDIRILKKTASVTDGLLFVLPHHYHGGNVIAYWAILDNNGVPRFHHKEGGRDFRRHADGTYSVNQYGVKLFDRLDARFGAIPLTKAVGTGRNTDVHDFLITPDGNHLFISYDDPVTRKVCATDPSCTEDQKVSKTFRDSVIQKVSPTGTELFLWNSWGNLKLEDCLVNPDNNAPGDYAHLNSLQVVGGGDIIASFRHCNQVLRIGRDGPGPWSGSSAAPVRRRTRTRRSWRSPTAPARTSFAGNTMPRSRPPVPSCCSTTACTAGGLERPVHRSHGWSSTGSRLLPDKHPTCANTGCRRAMGTPSAKEALRCCRTDTG